MIKLSLALLLVSVGADAKIPEWASHNSTKISGQILTTICHGTGPSLDIARGEALRSCQSNASRFLESKIRIKSLSVETEKDVGFHQEISDDSEIDGLACDPQRDEIDGSDSQFEIWIECKFNLKKVTTRVIEAKSDSPESVKLNSLEVSEVKAIPDTQEKYIFISTVPKCDSVLVKGTGSRKISCAQNPIKIQIKSDDDEILIRAKGYKPKSVRVKGTNANETIQVLLDLF